MASRRAIGDPVEPAAVPARVALAKARVVELSDKVQGNATTGSHGVRCRIVEDQESRPLGR
jgi:hypothetical protein